MKAQRLGLSLAIFLLVPGFILGCKQKEDAKWGNKNVDVQAAIQTLKGNDKQAQINALVDLAAAKADSAVPVLREKLKDPDPEIRRLSAYALYEIGPKAAAALPDLKPMLGDPDPQVAIQVVNTLRAIDPKAVEGVEVKNVMGGK